MDRTEIATRVLEALLVNPDNYENTNQIAYDAVEVTDLLVELLARPVNTVKLSTFEEDAEKAEALAEANEVEAERTSNGTEQQPVRKRNFLGF